MPITPEQQPVDTVRLAEHLGKLFSRSFDVRMVPQASGWACTVDNPVLIEAIDQFTRGNRAALDGFRDEDYRIERILFPRDQVAQLPLSEVMVGLRHEAGHVRFTNFKDLIIEQVQATDDGYLATSYFLMYEGLEDPRISILAGRESHAINRQIRDVNKAYLESNLQNEDLPLFAKLALNFHNMWLHGKAFEGYEDTEVGRATHLVEPLVYEYFRTTDENRLRELRQFIWERVRYLETMDVDKTGDSLQQEEQQQGNQSGSSEGNHEESREQSQQAGDGEGEAGTNSGSSQSAQRPPSAESESTAEQEGEGDTPIEGETGSEKQARKALSAAKRQSPDRQERRQGVDEQQRDVAEDIGSHLFRPQENEHGQFVFVPKFVPKPDNPESEKDENPTAEQSDSGSPPEMATESTEMGEIKMAMQGFRPDEEAKYRLYQQLAASVASLVERATDEIRQVLPFTGKRESIERYSTGQFIGRRALSTRVPAGEPEIFTREKMFPEGEPDFCVSLLVDNSGSMGGSKIQIARRAIIFLATLCQQLEIPFMAASFAVGATVIKDFDADFEDPAYRIKPQILDSTTANGGSTDLSSGIYAVNAGMDAFPNASRMKRIVFVLTDSGANRGLVGEELQRYIQEQQQQGTYFVAFGLGDDDEERGEVRRYLDYYFGRDSTIYPTSIEAIPQLLIDHLGHRIREIAGAL